MLHRRYDAAQHVIHALEVLDFFKRNDIFWFFHHANNVGFSRGANITHFVFGVVAAYFAKMDVLFHVPNSVYKFVNFIARRVENGVRITRRRLLPHGRKF